jgi:hypothetical protein
VDSIAYKEDDLSSKLTTTVLKDNGFHVALLPFGELHTMDYYPTSLFFEETVIPSFKGINCCT